jgi:hypothetical protein
VLDFEYASEINHSPLSNSAHETGMADVAAIETKHGSAAGGIHPYAFTDLIKKEREAPDPHDHLGCAFRKLK